MSEIWMKVEFLYDKGDAPDVPKPELVIDLILEVQHIAYEVLHNYPSNLGGRGWPDTWCGPILEPGDKVKSLVERSDPDRESDDTASMEAFMDLCDMIMGFLEKNGEWRHMINDPNTLRYYGLYRVDIPSAAPKRTLNFWRKNR